MRSIPRILALAIASLSLYGTDAGGVRGDEATPDVADVEAPRSAADHEPAKLRDVLDRLDRVENELLELKARHGEPIAADERRVLTLVETPFLGSTSYNSPAGRRYLAARLVFVNLTGEQLTVEPPAIKLHVDGNAVEYEDVPSNMQYYSFQVGNQSHQLRNLKPTPKLVLRPGATGSTWIVFVDLPQSNDVPQMELEIPVAGKSVRVDVNQAARDALAMSVERLGPSRSLGLITIDGSIDSVNAGTLVEALDQLEARKVARVVIRWTDSAPPLDGTVWGWLQQAAAFAGRQEMQPQQLPIIPAGIRELHLASVPGPNANSRSNYGNVSTDGRIHATDAEAITAALRTAYEVLPREELLREIRDGNPLTRAAAIAGGGGRLSAEHLPLLLRFAKNGDVHIQRAAVQALRHFGEPAAVAVLVEFVEKNTQPLATMAIESLARSRFPVAHEALLKVLANESPNSKVEIVKVLARYPRPIWADTIYEFVHSDNRTVATAALHALVQIGHPKLFDVLRERLEEDDTAMANQAFSILVERTDAASEELAMDYTLVKLQREPPTSSMYALLNRTKDPRAIPLLLRSFEIGAGDRSKIINTLAQIGDRNVAEAFADKYGELQVNEKVTVLRALQQMRSPAFRDLAGEALRTTENQLINAACDVLRMDASSEAVALLAEALETTSNSSAISYITNSLAQLATPDAKNALVKARGTSDENKRQLASRALTSMYQRSPGYNYMYQARSFIQQKKMREAIEQFDIALTLDPELPDALAERGNAHLHLDDLAKARADYKRALELDAWNSHAITGMGILMAREGSVDEAVKFVDDQRTKHPNNNVFAYNLACVYARGIESLRKADEPDEDRVDQLRRKAIDELARAKKLGFSELDWMQKDPDLEALHGDPEFVEVHSPGRKIRDGDSEAESTDEEVQEADVAKE